MAPLVTRKLRGGGSNSNMLGTTPAAIPARMLAAGRGCRARRRLGALLQESAAGRCWVLLGAAGRCWALLGAAACTLAPHPPVTMNTSMKKEPMAEAMVSVLHTHAMAWNSDVALRGGAAGGSARGQGCEVRRG